MINIIEDTFMVNQINLAVNNKPVKANAVQNLKTENSSDQSTSKSLMQSDQIQLSKSSRQLDALKASLQDLPEINEARIAYFKNEIALGTYHINSSNIANKMFNSEPVDAWPA